MDNIVAIICEVNKFCLILVFDKAFFNKVFNGGGDASFCELKVFGHISDSGIALPLFEFMNGEEIVNHGMSEITFGNFQRKLLS